MMFNIIFNLLNNLVYIIISISLVKRETYKLCWEELMHFNWLIVNVSQSLKIRHSFVSHLLESVEFKMYR